MCAEFRTFDWWQCIARKNMHPLPRECVKTAKCISKILKVYVLCGHHEAEKITPTAKHNTHVFHSFIISHCLRLDNRVAKMGFLSPLSVPSNVQSVKKGFSSQQRQSHGDRMIRRASKNITRHSCPVSVSFKGWPKI